MPTSQLTHPLFQPDHLSRLTLQPFHPVRKSLALLPSRILTFPLLLCILTRFFAHQETITPAVVSQALKFPHNDKDPFRIFGLPRNLLVEVS